jgi:hypothetical protein
MDASGVQEVRWAQRGQGIIIFFYEKEMNIIDRE